MRINKLVAKIISAPNFDSFSSLEVRAAYLTLHEDKSISANDARKFIYRDLIKLTDKGWLKNQFRKKRTRPLLLKPIGLTVAVLRQLKLLKARKAQQNKVIILTQ